MTAARKIRAAVVGASGYAGSELTRFLLAHPAVELTHLYVSAASSDAGRAIAEIDGRLFGRTQLVLEPMTDPAAAAQGLMLSFLATEHIVSAALAPIFAAQGAVVLIFPGPIDCRMHRIIRSFMGLSMSILNCLSRRFMPLGNLSTAASFAQPGSFLFQVLSNGIAARA